MSGWGVFSSTSFEFAPSSPATSRKVRGSEQKVPLTPGTYAVEGWSRLGDFDEAVFEVRAGEDREVVLRSKS